MMSVGVSDPRLYPLKMKVSRLAMICVERSVLVPVSPSAIWQHLVQVHSWSEWMPGVQRVELLESPKVDAIGQIYSVGGSVYSFRLTEIQVERRLQWERPFLFGTQLSCSYSLTRNAEGAILSITLDCSGLLERLVTRFMRRRLSLEVGAQFTRLQLICGEEALSRAARSPELKSVPSSVA